MPIAVVADDEPYLRELLADLLEEEGFTVRVVANGREALALLQCETADLLVLDLMMPVLDGWAVLAARAADPTLQGLPTVVLSASSAPGLDRARGLGADLVLPKPFHLHDLLTAVHAVTTGAAPSRNAA